MSCRWKRKQCAELLEKTLNGEISPCQARKLWPKCDSNDGKIFDYAYHILFHYEDDVDIRATDHQYRDWQRSEIQHLISELREDLT